MAEIDGWRSACPIGQFTPGQVVAYIPEGSLLPRNLIEELGLGVPLRLVGPGHNRVKAIQLRGLPSHGLVYSGDRLAGLSVGDDAADALGLEKWVPPVPERMDGTVVPGIEVDFVIDDIEHRPGRLNDGEEVVITEKLHGSFCCMGLTEGGVMDVVASKGALRWGRRFDTTDPDNDSNLYVKLWRRYAESIAALRKRLGVSPCCCWARCADRRSKIFPTVSLSHSFFSWRCESTGLLPTGTGWSRQQSNSGWRRCR